MASKLSFIVFDSLGDDGVNQPKVSAIEILATGGEQYPLISVAQIADQTNTVGDVIESLGINASGGNPSENFSYSISSQPLGVTVEPANGLIYGAIDANASIGGLNNDGVYNVDVITSKLGSQL